MITHSENLVNFLVNELLIARKELGGTAIVPDNILAYSNNIRKQFEKEPLQSIDNLLQILLNSVTTCDPSCNSFRLVRLIEGMTISEFATVLGITRSAVCQAESGERKPPLRIQKNYMVKYSNQVFFLQKSKFKIDD